MKKKRSALKNTSEYYLANHFDDEMTHRILIDEGLSKEDSRYVVEWIGGVPWMMERILESKNAKGKVEEFYKQHRARLLRTFWSRATKVALTRMSFML